MALWIQRNDINYAKVYCDVKQDIARQEWYTKQVANKTLHSYGSAYGHIIHLST